MVSFETDPFSNKKISNPLPISTKPFSLHELRKSLENVKISKAPGLDGIPAFLWKEPIFHEELLYFCNKTFEGNKPEAFSTSCLKPIPKTGDLGSTDNYQGISLTAIASKIYNSMLLSRISKYMEPILRHNQNGFRKGRSTLPQILAIRRIIEEIKIAKKEASLIFIDFSKAFDSISRSKMFHILSLYGIPLQIIDPMKIVYEKASCVVQSLDGTTEPFLTFQGVLQGDTLAPYLFVIVVDYILRQSVDNIHTNGITIKKQTSRRHPSKHLTDLDYADDMALISDTLPKAQELLNSLEKASNKVGLFLNAKKTKYMTINVDANHPPVTAQSGQVLEEVLDFKYLGSYIADSRKDFMTRKGQAWDVCNKLRLIWESNIAEETKVSFFRACVESILLYGCETWTMNRELEKRLHGAYTRMLKTPWSVHTYAYASSESELEAASNKSKNLWNPTNYLCGSKRTQTKICWTLLQSEGPSHHNPCVMAITNSTSERSATLIIHHHNHKRHWNTSGGSTECDGGQGHVAVNGKACLGCGRRMMIMKHYI